MKFKKYLMVLLAISIFATSLTGCNTIPKRECDGYAPTTMQVLGGDGAYILYTRYQCFEWEARIESHHPYFDLDCSFANSDGENLLLYAKANRSSEWDYVGDQIDYNCNPISRDLPNLEPDFSY